MQAVQFCALYLRDRLNLRRVLALVLGVAAVLAACASRLIAEKGFDPAVALLLVALVGLAAGGVYQQRFCADVDFRASTSIQNAVAFLPALALSLTTHFAVPDVTEAVVAVTGVVLLNATLGVSLYVRAINLHGAAAVSMLFCVIPAVAGLLSWVMLRQGVDVGTGIGLVLGTLASGSTAPASHAKTVKTTQVATAEGRTESRRSISPP